MVASIFACRRRLATQLWMVWGVAVRCIVRIACKSVICMSCHVSCVAKPDVVFKNLH